MTGSDTFSSIDNEYSEKRERQCVVFTESKKSDIIYLLGSTFSVTFCEDVLPFYLKSLNITGQSLNIDFIRDASMFDRNGTANFLKNIILE